MAGSGGGKPDESWEKETVIMVLLFSLATIVACYMYRNRKKRPEVAAERHKSPEKHHDLESAAVLEMEELHPKPVTFTNEYGQEALPESAPVEPEPIDEAQNPGELSPFGAIQAEAGMQSALQIIPLEPPPDVDATSESVFYKFSGVSQTPDHRAAVQEAREQGVSLWDPDEHISSKELDELLQVLDEFLLDPSLVWMFVEWSMDKEGTYEFRFIMHPHLLSEHGTKEFRFRPQCPAARIDPHMINLWIRSEEARKEVLSLALLQIFSFEMDPAAAGQKMRLLVPIALLLVPAKRPSNSMQEMCNIAMGAGNFSAGHEEDIHHAGESSDVAPAVTTAQVISYCVDGLDGKVYLFFDIIEPTQTPEAFKRNGTFLFQIGEQQKRWNWKHVVDGPEQQYYPDPICIEEHFRTIHQFSYSVIICPAWEVFIKTKTDDNAKHYEVLTSLQDRIKMLAISQTSPSKFLLQFLTENPTATSAGTSSAPSALRYAFISVIAEELGDTHEFVFPGVDPEEDIEGLVDEVKNAKLFYENTQAELPSLCYKIKFGG